MRLGIWLLIGFSIYFTYGRHHASSPALRHEILKHGLSPAGAIVTHAKGRPTSRSESAVS